MNTSREMVCYIEKAGILFFKLSNRLRDFGTPKGFNKTRLKERLLEHLPESQEQYDAPSLHFNKAVQSI